MSSRSGRRLAATAAAALGLAAIASPTAHGARIDARTFRISGSTFAPFQEGSSANAVLSAAGTVVAFDTTAAGIAPDDRNGAVRDVVLVDTASGLRRLVSGAPDALGADGPASDPALTASGGRVAFASLATNLVAGDTNSASDVFVRDGDGPVLLASVTPVGTPGNGPSVNADLSADGRFVVFESDASDLVPEDINGATDVFVRDLQASTTTRVSVTDEGFQGDGRSSTPAISANGRVVSFESAAGNLVPDDTNEVPDVFVRDLAGRRTRRVSVSPTGLQQDRAVPAPFRMASDLDRTGRRVVFESEATNLTPSDLNRSSDVFLVDRRDGTVRLVSAGVRNAQGNNDSVSPVITPDGRFVGFQSFATNLVRDDPGGADIFVRDVDLRTTSNVSVAADGSRRQPELVAQLLQRPALSDDARTATFISTASNVVPGDTNRAADVFVRNLTPPVTLGRRTGDAVKVAADDPKATRLLCYVDDQRPVTCATPVSLRQPGRRLVVRATGPGMLADPVGRRYLAIEDRSRPTIRLTRKPSRNSRTLTGLASDRGGTGIRRVEVSLTYFNRQHECLYLQGNRFVPTKNCAVRKFVEVTSGTTAWTLVLPRRLPSSIVVVHVRAVDRVGNTSKAKKTVTYLA